MRALRACMLLAAGLVPLQAPAQLAAPTGTSSDTVVQTVHGVVVGSIDGKPVAHALVTSGDQRLAVLTDTEGRFHFEVRRPLKTSGAPPGQPIGGFFRPFTYQGMTIVLVARRPGFLMTQLPVAITYADPQATVQLKLVPEAVLRGRVSVASGEVPEFMVVQLRRRQVQDGFATWTQAGGAQVNSRGEYRFPELAAGEYQVMTARWTERMPIGPNAPESTFGYAPTFSGDVSQPSAARSFSLKPGETVDADLHPRGEMLYRVSVPVKGLMQGVGVNAIFEEDEGIAPAGLQVNLRTQTVTGYLPKGAYTLRLTSFGQTQMSGTGRVEVAGMAVEGAPIQMQPAGTIAVHVREDLSAQQSDPATAFAPSIGIGRNRRALDLSLQAANGQQQGSTQGANVTDPDNFTLENVQEGTYRVRAQAFRGYVATMTSNGIDLLQHPLVVGKGGVSEPIEVVLRDDAATISGTIQGLAANSADTAMAALTGRQTQVTGIPLDTPMVRPARGGSSEGTFTLQNLAPGRYLVLATPFTAQQEFEYGNPEVLDRLRTKGTVVTLTPGQKAQIDVPMFVEEGK